MKNLLGIVVLGLWRLEFDNELGLLVLRWYCVGMFVGRFVYFFVGTESIRGYDSDRVKEVY